MHAGRCAAAEKCHRVEGGKWKRGAFSAARDALYGLGALAPVVYAALRQAPFTLCNTVDGNCTTRMLSFLFVLTVTAIPPASGNGSEITSNSSP